MDKPKKYSGYRLLIVDDEPDLVEIYRLEFTRKGFTVTTARSGNEASEILKTRSDFSIILSDFRMPDGTGLDVVRAANKSEKVIPVIIITGYIEQGVVTALLEGATAVYSKPVSFKEILNDIDRILELTTFEDNQRRYVRKNLSSVYAEIVSDDYEFSATYPASNISIGGVGIQNIDIPLVVNTSYNFKLYEKDETQNQKIIFEGAAVCRWQRRADLKNRGDKFAAGLTFDDNTSRQVILRNILKTL